MTFVYFIVPLAGLLLSTLLLWWLRWRAFAPLVRLAREQNGRVIPPDRPTPLVATTAAGFRAAPTVSVVLPSINDGWWLERHLGYYLQQRFANFEVIVADASDKDDDTPNVVKRWQTEHANLRYTYVPQTSRNIDLRKLALTLGIRSARAPWVIVAHPQAAPTSTDWMAHLSQHFIDEVDVVLGYANYDDPFGAPGRRAVLQRAKRFAQLASALFGGRATSCDGMHYAMRRSWFLEHGGFVDSLNLPFGESELLINAHAEEGRVAVELHRDAMLRLETPDEDTLKLERSQQAKLRAMMTGRCRWVYLRDALGSVALYMALAWLLTYVVVRVLYFFGGGWPVLREFGLNLSVDLPRYEWLDLAFDLPVLLLCVAIIWASLRNTKRWLGALPEYEYGSYPILYALLQPWRKSY